MKQIILMLIVAFCVSCAGEGGGQLKSINLEPVINDTTQIPASKLGKSIRYVALETGDSTTLISANPVVRQWRDKILVGSSKSVVKVFDAKTGKYLNSVGEVSRGPRGNSIPESFYVHPENGNIYMNSIGDNSEKQVWDINGNMLRKVRFPKIVNRKWVSHLMPQAIDDQGRFMVPIPVSCGMNDLCSLALFKEGDTVATRIIKQRDSVNIGISNIVSVSIMGIGATHMGSISQSGMFMVETKDVKFWEFGNDQFVWRHNDKVYFKQQYKDTVYQVIDTVIKPVLHFNMGKYAYNYKERFNKELDAQKLSSVTHVYENDDVMLLEWSMGANIGVYNKADGTIVAGKQKNGISDDINNFVPLTIHTMNDKGQFLAIVDPLRVVEWNEANPDKKSPLPDIDENANIVIAIIE